MNDRLLKESDVLKTAFQLPLVVNSAFADAVKALPSTDKPQKIIAQITFDEEKLHEIVKEAVERFKEECEITDRPQGKWINGHSTSGFYYKRCNQCFAVIDDTFFGESSFDVNFCPNCGAKMGYKDETNRPNRG